MEDRSLTSHLTILNILRHSDYWLVLELLVRCGREYQQLGCPKVFHENLEMIFLMFLERPGRL